jgi:glutamyl-tRNA(Gln) amidotransferase subunit E
MEIIKLILNSDEEKDAMMIFWALEGDVATALETIEERCQMALEGIPNETRKSFEDGTTIFERVLPGADRMYPDTDSVPIPLDSNHIDELAKNIPEDISDRYAQCTKWGIPEDTFDYLFSKNLFPYLKQIIEELGVEPKHAGRLFGQDLKYIEGHYNAGAGFDYSRIIDLIKFIKENNYHCPLGTLMLPELYQHPNMDFESILTVLKFKKRSKEDLLSQIDFMADKFDTEARNDSVENKLAWIMGQIRPMAVGNFDLTELKNEIENKIQ